MLTNITRGLPARRVYATAPRTVRQSGCAPARAGVARSPRAQWLVRAQSSVHYQTAEVRAVSRVHLLLRLSGRRERRRQPALVLHE